MNIKKIVYWLATLLMCALFLFSAGMYLLKYEMVTGFFKEFGFPVWVIYPLAIAKILGVVAILSNLNKTLREWAYAGFFFDVILATAAHYFAGHGLIGPSLFGIVLVIISRIMLTYRK